VVRCYTIKQNLAPGQKLCSNRIMALGGTLPIRLPQDIEERLQQVADKTGTSKSALVRLLVKTFLDDVEGGRIIFPPDWKEILREADGRTHRYPRMSDEEFERQLAAALQRPEDKVKTRKKAG
jgi:predicted DNA-binding protein